MNRIAVARRHQQPNYQALSVGRSDNPNSRDTPEGRSGPSSDTGQMEQPFILLDRPKPPYSQLSHVYDPDFFHR
jgi:hypothetical protein